MICKSKRFYEAEGNPNYSFQVSVDDVVIVQVTEATSNSDQLGFNEDRPGPPNREGDPLIPGD